MWFRGVASTASCQYCFHERKIILIKGLITWQISPPAEILLWLHDKFQLRVKFHPSAKFEIAWEKRKTLSLSMLKVTFQPGLKFWMRLHEVFLNFSPGWNFVHVITSFWEDLFRHPRLNFSPVNRAEILCVCDVFVCVCLMWWFAITYLK